MATKVTRKELKEPDEFISFTQRFLTWVNEQKTALIVGALALCLAIVGVVSWQWYQANVERAASMAFVRAQEILSAPVVAQEEDDETEAPEGSYPTESAKLEAALAEFEEVKKRHSSSRPAVLATYFIGECQRRLGNHQQAVDSLKEYLRDEGPGAELAVFALEGIGIALEAQGKDQEALAQFKRLTEPPFDAHADRGMYHTARLDQKAGKTAAARELFNQILEKYPKTAFRQEIQGRLDRMPVTKKAQPEKAESADPGKKTADEAVEKEAATGKPEAGKPEPTSKGAE